MNLYIKVIDGAPVGHPALESNLLEAFQNVIPPEFEVFVSSPYSFTRGVFQVIECRYVKNKDDVWTNNWSLRDMTDSEKVIETERLVNNIKQYISAQKESAQINIVGCMRTSDYEGVDVWTKYLNKCNDWDVSSFDPLAPLVIKPPYINALGNWEERTTV
jgi:hypothetical protein